MEQYENYVLPVFFFIPIYFLNTQPTLKTALIEMCIGWVLTFVFIILWLHTHSVGFDDGVYGGGDALINVGGACLAGLALGFLIRFILRKK